MKFSKLTGIKLGINRRTFVGNCLDWKMDIPKLPKRRRRGWGKRRKW